MLFTPNNTYNDIREKSQWAWLDDMEKHEDITVLGGVKPAREYIQYLQDEIKRLEEKNALTDGMVPKCFLRRFNENLLLFYFIQ